MVSKKSEAQSLQKRIAELERQLGDAQAAIHALQTEEGHIAPVIPMGAARDISFTNEAGYKLALQAAPYPLMIWREDGRILMVNTVFTEISGYSLEDIPTIHAWSEKAMAGHLLAQPSPIFYEELPGRDVKKTRELEITTRAGEKLVWDFRYAVLGTDQDEHWLMITMAVDITERRQIDEWMEEHEKKFTIIFDKAPFAAALSKLPNGVITDVNEEFERALGYTKNETLGRTSLEIGFNPNQEERAQILEQFKNRGNVRNVETLLRTKSGETRNFLLNLDEVLIGGQKYIFQTAQDITERKQSEQALRESEQRYRGLFESMQEGLIAGEVISDESGRPINFRYLEVNPATERQYDIPRQKFIGHTYTEVLPQDDQAWIEILGSVALTGEPANVERYSQVSERWFEAHAYSPLPGQFVNILTDISERKKAEEALRKSEERFSKAFRAIPDAVVISRMSDGLIIDVNEGWSRIVGHEQREVIGQSSLELGVYADPEDRESAAALFKEHGSLHDFELQIRLKSGEIRQASMSTERIEMNGEDFLLTILRDITERKMAEEALQRFQLLSEHSRDIMLFMRFQDGHILEANAAAAQAYGYSHIELLGLTISDLRGAGTINLTAEQMAQANESGILFETIHRRKDGSSFPVEVSSQGATIGGIRTLVSIVRDITERKLAEEQLKIYAGRLEKSNRELEQFAFMASHDLQEPLRKIEMFGDLLLERAADLQENERMYLSRMRDAAGRMRDMIEGLLQISRVATLGRPFERVDLSSITEEVISDFDDQIKVSGGRVEISGLPVVSGDPLQLRQLMQNLIGNALKYHQPGMPPEVRIFAKQLPGKVQIYVQDKGIGFPQQDADRIFEPFQRLVGRSQYEGNGIGLAICRRIVERHGGEIAAISEPGQGSTFLVTLPGQPAKKSRGES